MTNPISHQSHLEKSGHSLKEFIQKLLQKNPQERIYGCANIQLLDFFAGKINFATVENHQYNSRIFFTNEDIAKLPDGSLKRWILQDRQDSDRNLCNSDNFNSSHYDRSRSSKQTDNRKETSRNYRWLKELPLKNSKHSKAKANEENTEAENLTQKCMMPKKMSG
ncbi:unnamed protein product [Trichobilharzia szidati]|nr:unnamed protein product [Trichobilharzia szidati]